MQNEEIVAKVNDEAITKRVVWYSWNMAPNLESLIAERIVKLGRAQNIEVSEDDIEKTYVRNYYGGEAFNDNGSLCYEMDKIKDDITVNIQIKKLPNLRFPYQKRNFKLL